MNVAGTGGEHKAGARRDWSQHREMYHREWRKKSAKATGEAADLIRDISSRVQANSEEGWKVISSLSLDVIRQMLQALSLDTTVGEPVKQKMEWRLREVVRQSKELKKRPPGDFVKLLITHRGWNAAEVAG